MGEKEMTKLCTPFEVDCYENIPFKDQHIYLIRCPKCKAFLPRYIKDKDKCKKCGETIYIIYDDDEETHGKYCIMPDSIK